MILILNFFVITNIIPELMIELVTFIFIHCLIIIGVALIMEGFNLITTCFIKDSHLKCLSNEFFILVIG